MPGGEAWGDGARNGRGTVPGLKHLSQTLDPLFKHFCVPLLQWLEEGRGVRICEVLKLGGGGGGVLRRGRGPKGAWPGTYDHTAHLAAPHLAQSWALRGYFCPGSLSLTLGQM